jgi:hypothetical protein
MPDIIFKTRDEIPEGLRDEVKEEGGVFKVSVVSTKKLNEFRDTNITVSKERDTLRERLNRVQPIIGDDPDAFAAQYAEMQSVLQQVKDGKLKTTPEIEKAVTERVASMKAELDGQITGLSTKLNAELAEKKSIQAKYDASVRHGQVTQAVIAGDSNINPSALPDILRRADEVFVVQPDGTLVPKKGDSVIYGSDGATPMTVKEWLTKLVQEAPYLGKSSTGGGAGGGTGNTFGGYSQEEFQKLPPAKRLALERAKNQKARA